MNGSKQSRREFLSNATLGALGTMGTANLFSNSNSLNTISSPKTIEALQEYSHLTFLKEAPEGGKLRAGLVGCGGRGTGAAVNFVDAGPNLEITALGDLFPDQLTKCRNGLKKARGIDVPEENSFAGWDSYKKVIASGVDIVLFVTPPYFRPMQVEAAIEAGKHVFQEKPLAVDPVGARRMIATAKKAKERNLSMVSGTLRRYQKDYVETQRQVADGAIGEIVSANILRNGGATWWVKHRPEWKTEMEYMLRNWYNFSWLSGDHYVEQFIHELDVMNGYINNHPGYINTNPVKAIGYGGREQRQSGNIFDQFNVVYSYEDGKKVHTATRQINGTHNGKVQHITGTKGYADASGKLYDLKGEVIWEYPYPDDNDIEAPWAVKNGYVQEHIELITAIRTDNYINDTERTINSVRLALMGRMAAYTGKEITWEDVVSSDLRLGPETEPEELEFGPVEGIRKTPVIGIKPSADENRYR